MLVAGASATTTKVVLNCHTSNVIENARGVLKLMESSTIAEDASSEKSNKAAIAKAAAGVASSKKALDACYVHVGAKTPANKSTANNNKCSKPAKAFSLDTIYLNSDSCLGKIYDLKAS
jgi:hypothetical protein